MSYICGKSRNKIVHHLGCRYIKIIPMQNQRHFSSFKEAAEAGYVQCKYCAGIEKYLREENKVIRNYCVSHGIYYAFNASDGSLDVISHSGKWKIVVEKYPNVIGLYHQNNNVIRKRDFVPGFHKQNARFDTLMGYMSYIVDHDIYRFNNPIYENSKKKMGRGIKAQRNIKFRENKLRKLHSISYVNNILDKISAERHAT